jgi:hypothetical protein
MFKKKKTNGFVWAVDDFGTNFRMTEMQAAIGRSMLAKLDSWVAMRRKLAGILNRGFSGSEQLRTTIPPEGVGHSYYKYYVFVRPQALRPGWDRDRIIRVLNEKGIPCGSGVCPEIYREKAFSKFTGHSSLTSQKSFPVARELGRTSLMFAVHPTLTEKIMNSAVEEMRELLCGKII